MTRENLVFVVAGAFIDLSGGKNLLYLPLQGNKAAAPTSTDAIAPLVGATPEPVKGGR